MGGYAYLSFVLLLFPVGTNSIPTEYLTEACNTTGKSLDGSLRIEPSSSLTYYASTSCFYNVVVDAGNSILLSVSMFDLEPITNGVCVDYVNVHDGSDISAATLNSEPMCGLLPFLTNRTFVSTGNEMTIYFHTDHSGQRRGFELILVPVGTGVCSSSQITCVNTSVCVDISLRCNTIDECGDNTDEDGCSYAELQQIRLNPSYKLIVGLVLGIVGFLGLVALVGVKLWYHNRWRLYTNKPMTANMELEPTTYETAYPVTKLYYKDKYRAIYENPAGKKAQLGRKQAEAAKQDAEAIETKRVEAATKETEPGATIHIDEKKLHFVANE